MNIRRTSGEIVNATLLETFLALVFLIFGLALFENQRADAAEKQIAGAIPADSANLLKRRHDSLLALAKARRDSLEVMNRTADSLRGILISKFPPDCEPTASPPEWISVAFIGGRRIHVSVRRSMFGFQAGQSFDIGAEQFGSRFHEAVESSRAAKCRYRVSVEDTKATSKDEFKEMLRVVSDGFRPQGYLR